jgi:hypothetical protein
MGYALQMDEEETLRRGARQKARGEFHQRTIQAANKRGRESLVYLVASVAVLPLVVILIKCPYMDSS